MFVLANTHDRKKISTLTLNAAHTHDPFAVARRMIFLYNSTAKTRLCVDLLAKQYASRK